MNARTAATFFTALTEESTLEEVLAILARAYTWDGPSTSLLGSSPAQSSPELDALEKKVKEKVGATQWAKVLRLAGVKGLDQDKRRYALILLYAHLLREPVTKSLQDRGWFPSSAIHPC